MFSKKNFKIALERFRLSKPEFQNMPPLNFDKIITTLIKLDVKGIFRKKRKVPGGKMDIFFIPLMIISSEPKGFEYYMKAIGLLAVQLGIKVYCFNVRDLSYSFNISDIEEHTSVPLDVLGHLLDDLWEADEFYQVEQVKNDLSEDLSEDADTVVIDETSVDKKKSRKEKRAFLKDEKRFKKLGGPFAEVQLSKKRSEALKIRNDLFPTISYLIYFAHDGAILYPEVTCNYAEQNGISFEIIDQQDFLFLDKSPSDDVLMISDEALQYAYNFFTPPS